MTNIFKNGLLAVAMLGCISNMQGADRQKNTDAKTWQTVLASAATVLGVALTLYGVARIGHPETKLPFGLNGLPRDYAYASLLIPGVVLTGGSAIYSINKAQKVINKGRALAGSALTGFGALVLAAFPIMFMNAPDSPSDAALASLIFTVVGVGSTALGYAIQPKNAETQQS